eukprot:2134637-Pyramimonas_sp.AAC.1
MIKSYLIEHKGHSKQDARIIWPKGAVEINFKKVAWITDDSEVHATEEEEAMKEAVGGSMKEWRAKRE